MILHLFPLRTWNTSSTYQLSYRKKSSYPKSQLQLILYSINFSPSSWYAKDFELYFSPITMHLFNFNTSMVALSPATEILLNLFMNIWRLPTPPILIKSNFLHPNPSNRLPHIFLCLNIPLWIQPLHHPLILLLTPFIIPRTAPTL